MLYCSLKFHGLKTIAILIEYWHVNIFCFKWDNNLCLFLLIFVLCKHKLYIKTVGFSRIQTRIVGVEGDHLTTTTAMEIFFL